MQRFVGQGSVNLPHGSGDTYGSIGLDLVAIHVLSGESVSFREFPEGHVRVLAHRGLGHDVEVDVGQDRRAPSVRHAPAASHLAALVYAARQAREGVQAWAAAEELSQRAVTDRNLLLGGVRRRVGDFSVAGDQSGHHRGPYSADARRPTADLQRWPASHPVALLRQRGKMPRSFHPALRERAITRSGLF